MRWWGLSGLFALAGFLGIFTVSSPFRAEVPAAPALVPATAAATLAATSAGEATSASAWPAAATDAPAPGQKLVVLDPGHGGANTGAASVDSRVYEKRITLALATCVRDRLRERGVAVVLTRADDRYLSLRERVRLANQLGADLLVSIHGNATEDHAQRGYETFVLTPEALDIDGRALRDRDGRARPGTDARTAFLLDDLERGAAFPRAAEVAASVQEELRRARGPAGDRGVRQSAMHVLLGATMPAVLVEVGFIDHAIEGVELLDPAVQREICDALAIAIARE
jgi:N-acetylmuramoyl-L-alanine amidase